MNRYSKQFEMKIPIWAAAQHEKADAIARQVCLEMGKMVIEETPVDVGFLRGSWQPSIGSPHGIESAQNDPGGSGALTRISLVALQVVAGNIFYLMNNAAYALRIEFGFVGTDSLGRTYNQRGRYFVTWTVARFNSVVRKVIADLGFKQ